MANPVGKPSDYNDKVKPFLNDISYWVLLGYTNKEIAQKLDICMSTFCDYQNKYPEFVQALKKNKPLSLSEVVRAVHKRAKGYQYKEIKTVRKPLYNALGLPVLDKNGNQVFFEETTTTIKEMPSETKAAQTFLLNRDRQNWQLTSGFKIEDKREKDTTDIDKVFDLLDQSRKELLEKESENK